MKTAQEILESKLPKSRDIFPYCEVLEAMEEYRNQNDNVSGFSMQDLMLYYSKSGNDFTTPVIDVLSEMGEVWPMKSVVYGKIKSTMLWYPAKFIVWVNDNFYWDKGLGGYLPTTTEYQGMSFKTTEELFNIWPGIMVNSKTECGNIRKMLMKYTQWLRETIWGLDELDVNNKIVEEYLKTIGATSNDTGLLPLSEIKIGNTSKQDNKKE